MSKVVILSCTKQKKTLLDLCSNVFTDVIPYSMLMQGVHMALVMLSCPYLGFFACPYLFE